MNRLTPLLVAGLLFATTTHAKERTKKERIKGPAVCAAFSSDVVTKLVGDGMTMEASRFAPMCSWTRPLPDADARNEAFKKEMTAWTMARVAAMQARKEPPPMPKAPVTTESVSVSWRGDASSPADAKQQLAQARRAISEGITVSASGSGKAGYKTKVKIGDKRADGKDVAEAEREANDAARELVKEAPKNAPVDKAMAQERTVTMTVQADVVDVPGVGDGAFWNEKHRALTVVKGARMFTVNVDVAERDARELAIALARAWM